MVSHALTWGQDRVRPERFCWPVHRRETVRSNSDRGHTAPLSCFDSEHPARFYSIIFNLVRHDARREITEGYFYGAIMGRFQPDESEIVFYVGKGRLLAR